MATGSSTPGASMSTQPAMLVNGAIAFCGVAAPTVTAAVRQPGRLVPSVCASSPEEATKATPCLRSASTSGL